LLGSARADHRIVLTRDKRLRTAPDVIYLRCQDFRGQLCEVLARVPFDPRRRAFTRCSRCNSELIEVSRDLVGLRIPPYVYATNERLAECPGCGRLYWGATHRERALSELTALGL
ncbi:MAG: Mut7-C RNAse domain-containing protein, partial [Candidatus Binataceae bacterium]